MYLLKYNVMLIVLKKEFLSFIMTLLIWFIRGIRLFSNHFNSLFMDCSSCSFNENIKYLFTMDVNKINNGYTLMNCYLP